MVTFRSVCGWKPYIKSTLHPLAHKKLPAQAACFCYLLTEAALRRSSQDSSLLSSRWCENSSKHLPFTWILLNTAFPLGISYRNLGEYSVIWGHIQPFYARYGVTLLQHKMKKIKAVTISKEQREFVGLLVRFFANNADAKLLNKRRWKAFRKSTKVNEIVYINNEL